MMDLVNSKIAENIKIQSVYSFLNKTEFCPTNLQNSIKIKDILDNQKFEIFDLFEFNKNITMTEASIKYEDIINSINEFFNTKFKLNEIYAQYNKYTSASFPLNRFINFLQIINYIIQNFGEIFIINNNNLLKTISNIKIEIFEIEQSQISSLSKKLLSLYKNLENDSSNNINIILLIFLLSLGNIVNLDNDGMEFNELMTYISIYNKIYISNIYISFLFFLDINILINMYITCLSRAKFNGRNKRKEKKSGDKMNDTVVGTVVSKIGRNKNKFSKSQIWNSVAGLRIEDQFGEKNIASLLENINPVIPNLYLYDCENSNFPEDEKFKIIIFQSYLQMYMFYILSKKKIKFSANLTVDNINEFDINCFKEINEIYFNKINVKNYHLITEENINIIFQNLSFNDLIIKITSSDNQNYIKLMCNMFPNQISKSVYFYMQESLSISQSKQQNELSDNYITLVNVFSEFNILINLLSFLCKNFFGKNLPQHMILKFNIFKCSINANKKDIQIYFNYSKVKERILLEHLITSSNILDFSKLYIKILKNLCGFKNYKITVRISQTNFRSSQLNFCFLLLTKKIYDFFEEQKEYKIIIAESQMANFNPNMQVYIKEVNSKKRIQISQIKKIINYYHNKLKVLNDYLDSLSDIFDVIVFSDNDKEFKTLNTLGENKLFIYITKNIADNTNKNNNTQNIKNIANSNISKSLNDEKQKNKIKNDFDDNVLNIIIQLKNNSNSFDSCMTFLLTIFAENDIQYKTTLICDRFFLEGNVLVEPSMKQCANIIYRYVDNFFLLAKNNKEDEDYYNYNVYISSKIIIVENNHLYDFKSDNKYITAINEFISVNSSCIELITYILRYKDMIVPRFMYIIRTKIENHFVLEFKNSNIIVRKLKKYDLPLNFNLKKSEPLLFLLSSKKNSEFTINTNDFFDIFLRLFLNLNKITNYKSGNVNQEFFQKIHKTIFHQYYDTYSLAAYNYEAFNFFNSFFVDNDYLSISKNEKFNECYFFILSNLLSKKGYESFIRNKNKIDNLIVKNISIVDFHLNQNFIINNSNNLRFGYRKTEFFVKEWENLIGKNIKKEINLKIKYLIQKMKMKNLPKKKVVFILQNIKKLFVQEGLVKYFDSDSNHFNKMIGNYQEEKAHIKVQNIEGRILQLTQEAKDNFESQNNEQNKNKKDCSIF